MKTWTCWNSPCSGSRNAWRWIKNTKQWQTSEQLLEFFWHYPNDFLLRLVTMHETWLYHYDPETKQLSMEWRHSCSPHPKKFRVQKSVGKVLVLIFKELRPHPPHWLSSKGPNYQGGVLLISAGAVEWHFEGKTLWEGHQGVLFLHDNALAHWALATWKKLAYLGFQCLDHPPYSLDLAPLDYHLFPDWKNNWKVAIFCPTWRSLLPQRPGWTENLLNFFWVACKS